MSSLDQAKLWWQRQTGEEETPLDGDTPAWAVSMLVHVAVLVSLALCFIPREQKSRPALVIDSSEVVEDVFTPPPEDVSVSEEQQESVGAQSEESVAVAEAVAPVLADVSVVPVEISEALDSDIHVEVPDVDMATAQNLDANFAVKGDVGVGTEGASGAVDRLTAEIRASLELRPTLVCWVFDQSVSLAGQRREIASRLERVFDELGATGSVANRPELLNQVFAFGKQVTPIVIKPTREVGEVVKAITDIPVDESGVEMTFTAVARAAEAAKVARISPRDRNVMIIVFTDEVGNDEKMADQVAVFCRNQAMRVYVVGVPAPFGRRQVQMRFVEFDPQYAGDEQWPVVDQGPETLHPELVNVRYGKFADEPMDSGFGPFSLSKLCAETGGIYFAVHANRNARGRVNETAPMSSRLRYFFDHDVMKQYRPDYVSEKKLDQELAANRAKRALVDAAKATVQPLTEPRTVFPKEDEGRLVQLFSEAQKQAAVLAPKIDAIYGLLATGLGDRQKLAEKRWQAGYDLALGRVLAAKVRNDAYNQMLANAKAGLKFKDEKNDTWELVPDNDVSTVGSVNEKFAKQAREALERVVAQHPGTPWAMIASEELETPLGYAWREKYTGVNAPRMDAGGNGNPNPNDDARRKLAPPKPKRPLKNL